MPSYISDEELLSELRELNEQREEIPGVRAVQENGRYNYATYRRRFGGIGEALEAAGIDTENAPGKRGTGNIDEEELLDDLRRLTAKLGRTPKTTDVENHGQFCPATYYYRFDDFETALERAEVQD